MNNIIDQSKNSIDQVIENLLTIHPLLTKNYTKAIRSKTNLTPGSLFVLGALHHHGKLSMSEISCRLSAPKPHVTAMVDKLIADNLVERLNDPSDRRIIYIQITEKGADDFRAIKKEISQELKFKLELLSDEQIQLLSNASQQLKEILIQIFNDQNSPHCSSAENMDKTSAENKTNKN